MDAPEEQQQTSSLPRKSRLPAYVDKPIFIHGRSGDRSGSIWSQRTNRKGRAGGSASGSDSGEVGTAQGTGWMDRRGTGRGFKEAFDRVGEEEEYEHGAFPPKQSVTGGGVRPKTAGALVAPSKGTKSPSRIPRSRSVSSTITGKENSSPPKIIKDMFARAEREESARIASGSGSSEQSREGSPSPHPKDRRGTKELVIDRDTPSVDGNKKLTQYERDRARRARILANPTPLFVRNDVGQRVAETTRTLTRKTSIEVDGRPSYEDEAEPPLNIPRAWGAKARARPGWIQRILSPDTSLEIKDEVESINAEYQQAQAEAEAEAEAASPDIPLPSIELGSEPTPPSSRPTSAQPGNEFLEEKSYLQPWDADADFTAQSLLATSPMLKLRNTGSQLDDVRQREIKSLSARAVATNRLEEIRERNSEERSVLEDSRARGSSLGGEVTPDDEAGREPENAHERPVSDDKGIQIPDTPVTVYPRGTYKSKGRNSDGEKPRHKREDSYETLRQLARVLSQSPAPSSQEKKERLAVDVEEHDKPAVAEVVAKKPERSPSVGKVSDGAKERRRQRSTSADEQSKKSTSVSEPSPEVVPANSRGSHKGKGLEIDNETKRRSRASSPPKSDVDPEERITAEAKLFELRDDKSERNSIRAPSRSPSPAEDGKHDETPRPKPDPLSLPTPRVTGAYIETPAPTTRKLNSQRSISPNYEIVDPVNEESIQQHGDHSESVERESKGESSNAPWQRVSRFKPSQAERPRLINTAKRPTAAEDLRRIKLEENIEDSTLDDLDLLLGGEGPDNTLQEPLIDLEYDDRGLPLTPGEKERRMERVILDRMARRLKNTSSSIRDARQGIERLEHEVSSSPILRATAADGDDSGHYMEVNIKMKVPRLYTITTPPEPSSQAGWFTNRNWKFTWLGLILFIFATWYVTETAMCEAFCHPMYSSHNTWHPSDPFFPWAIPTKLDQWTGEVVSGAYKGVEKQVMDWYDPDRFKRIRQPKGVYMGANDWWVGRDGPQKMYKPDRGEGGVGSIFDDDVYDDQ